MIRFPSLESLGLAVAAMSDKSDGDCRLPSESNSFIGVEARKQFLSSLGCNPMGLVCVRQIHGADVMEVGERQRGQGGFDASTAPREADAIITNTVNLPIGISIADCVPLLLYDPETRAAGAAHAGRLGTMANIAAATVTAMTHAFGTNPSDLHVVIGPSAGPDQYEVSQAIADEFHALGLPRNGRLLDLWGANRLQLEQAGVPRVHIDVSGECTISNDRFFSHRADGTGGRNLAVIMI